MLGAWLLLAMVVLIGAEGRESVHAVIWFLMPRERMTYSTTASKLVY